MFNTVWEWLKKAPLPVVLAITLPLGAWVFYTQDALHAEQIEQKAKMGRLAEEDAESQAQLEKYNEKLEKILAAVLELKAQLIVHEQESEKRAEKKEGKK